MCLTIAHGLVAAERPGQWARPYDPCDGHGELLKSGHMSLGVRFATLNPQLTAAFARAMSFWASVLDMEWRFW